ncbi:MAG: aminoglycoside phosphotransferase family protein [Rhizomicrobium sp.]|nr:aminoglycoside phosphotransferase family protein [Rhizomicrobium sp.]
MTPGQSIAAETLAEGISCDVTLVTVGARRFCVKQALAKMRGAVEWRAPAERSHAEVAWMKLVGGLDPDWVPMVLGEDKPRHLFAMEYLPPETHPVWKVQLAAGHTDPSFAAKVGARLVRIHGETAGREDIARDFRNGPQFQALRVDAYLLYAAAKHTDVAPAIRSMAKNLAVAHIALMQGSVSPENILCGPDGPVFLDAEAASYGDPAFDLAFCLSHLLLKAVWYPSHSEAYAACYRALKDAYLATAAWEGHAGLERRTAGFVAALLLAHIDGKAPIDYVSAETDKVFVRANAKAFLVSSLSHLDELLERWTEALSDRQMLPDS